MKRIGRSFWLFGIPIALSLSSQYALGDVYLEKPGKEGEKGEAEEGSSPAPLSEHKLWREPVIINGLELGLEIYLLDEPFDLCLEKMKLLYPDAKSSRNLKSLLYETEKNGVKRRIYIVGIGGLYPCIEFAIDLPRSIPADFRWPAELPLVPGSEPVRCVAMPDRGAVCGTFKSAVSARQTLDQLEKILMSDGWEPGPAGNEQESNSSGRLFLKDNPLRIMNIAVKESDTGMSFATVYLHRPKQDGSKKPRQGQK